MEKKLEKIKISNARLSFPNIFHTSVFGGEDTGKFDATFLLDKKEHAEIIKTIKVYMQLLADEKFKGKLPPDDKICLRDGDETERPEQQGMMVIKANSKRRPLVINRDKSPITEDDNLIYAGCRVNAIISLWAQNNQFGKRINASLEGVQFCAHDEPFGPPSLDVDAFDAFGSDNDVVF